MMSALGGNPGSAARRWRLALVPALVLVLAGAGGCAKVATGRPSNGGGNGGVDAAIGFDTSTASDQQMGGIDLVLVERPACTPVSCTPPGGQYCGVIGNGCLSSQDCGSCPGDQVCTSSICVGGPSCVSLTCDAPGGARYCGPVGDGCGKSLDCGTCPGGQDCRGGVCVVAGCVPLSCNIMGGGKYCGSVGDGCGGALDCGACGAPQTCGGGGTEHVCGAPLSLCTTPTSCMPAGGGQYCGTIGNGCGGTIDCAAPCPGGMACRADHVCPSSATTCVGLQCQIDACPGMPKTTVSGIVYDPAGRNPLYNVVLYVPNAPLDPIPDSVSCDRCDSAVSGRPVAAGLSNAQGHFQIQDVPSGTNIPLVIQVGKWRRQITLPLVKPCQDNPFNDPTQFRLPSQKSEGHLPLIALSTGHADTLDCLLRKIGIADSEFTSDTGGGRVHLYVGGAGVAGDQGAKQLVSGATFADSYQTLFPSFAKMSTYDIVILQCEGEQLATQKTAADIATMRRYADSGGRIFAEHLHSAWIRLGLPPWGATGTWLGGGAADLNAVAGTVNTSFAKGASLADWLVAVGASTVRGQLPLAMAQNSVNAVSPPTQAWITAPASAGTATQYLTFNTPLEAAAVNQCGRVTFTDVHVGLGDDPAKPFPTACPAALDMSPQEKALEFMFFDLSSCVQVDTVTPVMPRLPPPGVTPPPGIVQIPPPPPPPVPPPPPPPIP